MILSLVTPKYSQTRSTAPSVPRCPIHGYKSKNGNRLSTKGEENAWAKLCSKLLDPREHIDSHLSRSRGAGKKSVLADEILQCDIFSKQDNQTHVFDCGSHCLCFDDVLDVGFC